MVFELIPYTGLDVFSFNMTRRDAYDIFGEPDRKIRMSGKKIFQDVWYQTGIYLFFEEESLNEINVRPSIPKNEGRQSVDFIFLHYDIFGMPPDYIHSELCRLDGNPIKKIGATILLNLGVGLYGFDQYAVNGQDERSFGLYKKGLWDDIIP